MYSAIAGVVTGLFTVATFLVRTVARKVSSLVTFLASDFVHIGRFLPVNTEPQNPQTKLQIGEMEVGVGKRGMGGGEERYRTVPGAMSLCIAVATDEFRFLRTICAEMSCLLTTTTSDRGQKFLGKRFVAFLGGMTFLTININSSPDKKGIPAIATPVVPGRTITRHMPGFANTSVTVSGGKG